LAIASAMAFLILGNSNFQNWRPGFTKKLGTDYWILETAFRKWYKSTTPLRFNSRRRVT